MDTLSERKPDDQQSASTDKEQQTAVPYIPPPPPDETSLKKLQSPLVNGILAACVILLGGFMAYNAVGHQLTQISGISSVQVYSPTPTVTPRPSLSPSPTP
jgi:hypothetical protein